MLKKNVARGFKTTMAMAEPRIGVLIWDVILINAPPPPRRRQLGTVGVGVVQSSSIHGAEVTDGAGTMVIGGAATVNGEEETFSNVPDGKVLPFHQHYRPH